MKLQNRRNLRTYQEARSPGGSYNDDCFPHVWQKEDNTLVQTLES